MPLHPPSPRRERILAVGFSGGGKSTAWLNIARWLAKTGSPNHMYVLDTDRTWEAMRPLDGSLDGVVTAYDVETWPQMKTYTKVIRDKAGPDDWFVFDMIDTLWSASQAHYFGEVEGQDWEEFLMGARKSGESIGGEYGANWGIINKLYASVNDQIKRFPGHVFACTPGDQVREAGKSGKGGERDPNVVREFGKFGVKPVGQKKLRHDYHTILLFQDEPKGYTVTTLKERNAPGSQPGDGQFRESLVGKSHGEFVLSYLVGVAGWKVA